MKNAILIFLTAFVLVSCSPSRHSGDVMDVFEERNRKVHNFNKKINSSIPRRKPAEKNKEEKGNVSQKPNGGVAQLISNVAENLDAPKSALNSLLQGRLDKAYANALSFVVNTTVGLGGMFNPASGWGVERFRTGFGETLYVWGAPEGNYVELPILGGTTERDVLGRAGDAVISVFGWLDNPILTVARISANVSNNVVKRRRYDDTIDSVLYDSADSYSQLRYYIVQQRRYELERNAGLRRGATTDDFLDPYEN